MKARILLLVLLGALVASLAAQPVTLPQDLTRTFTPRMLSLGGMHSGSSSGLDPLFGNPAGLAGAETTLSLTQVELRASGRIFSIASAVIEASADGIDQLLADPTALSDVLSRLYAGFDIGGPIAFGFQGGGLGFGLFNRTFVELENAGANQINVLARERLLFRGGYAFRIPADRFRLDLGIMLGAFVTGEARLETTLFGIFDLIEADIFATLTGQPFELTTGVGLDAGLQFAPVPWLTFGLVVNNAYAPANVAVYPSVDAVLGGGGTPTNSFGLVPLDLTAGFAIDPPLGGLGLYISDLVFYADYRDALDFLVDPARAENPILKASAGMELVLLEAFRVRAGFGEGLLAAGFGLDLGVLQLNAAMFGDELALEPGIRSVYNIVLGLDIQL